MPLAPLLLLAASLQAPSAGEVPFRISETAIIVDATINNRKVSLMFDTGFSGAVDLGSNIDIGPATGTIHLRDFVGEVEAATTKIKSLKLGQRTIDPTGLEAVLSGDQDYSFIFNTHCDGLMGFSALQGNVVEINFEQKKFIFHPDSTDITKRVPDGKRTFLAKLLPTGDNSLMMEVLAPTGKKMVMALDTGNSFYATTHKDVLERVGLWTVNKEAKFLHSSGVASGEVASWEKKMAGMTIFGVPVPESIWDIIDLPAGMAEMDGTVGFGFLKNFNITFDYNRRRVWLENFSGKVGNDPEGDIGISAFVDPDDKRLKVFRIAPDSPAEKAGIQKGDHILSIDGNENLNVGFRKLRKLFEGPKGSKAQLVISRQGETLRFEIERDYLVND